MLIIIKIANTPIIRTYAFTPAFGAASPAKTRAFGVHPFTELIQIVAWYILVTESCSQYINVRVALVLWFNLLRPYEIPRRIFIFLGGNTQAPDSDIMMQNLSIKETVIRTMGQVFSDVRAPGGGAPSNLQSLRLGRSGSTVINSDDTAAKDNAAESAS
jgi:hypothetical protein